jgi:hypothetical protein
MAPHDKAEDDPSKKKNAKQRDHDRQNNERRDIAGVEEAVGIDEMGINKVPAFHPVVADTVANDSNVNIFLWS